MSGPAQDYSSLFCMNTYTEPKLHVAWTITINSYSFKDEIGPGSRPVGLSTGHNIAAAAVIHNNGARHHDATVQAHIQAYISFLICSWSGSLRTHRIGPGNLGMCIASRCSRASLYLRPLVEPFKCPSYMIMTPTRGVHNIQTCWTWMILQSSPM